MPDKHSFSPVSKKVYPHLNNAITDVLPNGNFSNRQTLLRQYAARKMSQDAGAMVNRRGLPDILRHKNDSFATPHRRVLKLETGKHLVI